MDKTERLHELKEIVKKFHPVNYDVFRYIITHLNRFSIFQFCLSCNSCNNELCTRIENVEKEIRSGRRN